MDNDTPLIIDTGKGNTVFFKAKYLYSKYDPVRKACEAAKNYVFQENTLYILPSPLLLHGMDILLDRLPINSSILAVEIDKRLYEISRKECTGGERTGIFFIESIQDLLHYVNEMGIWRFRRCEKLVLNGGYSLYPERYDGMIDTIVREINLFWQNRMTSVHLHRLWIKNLFTNILFLPLMKPYRSLRINSVPFIAGAGESLESALELIKIIRKDITLISVDTALGVLDSAGIRPDLVFVMDAQHHNLNDFTCCSHLLELPFIFDLTCYSEIMLKQTGPKYYFMSRFSPVQLLDRLKSILPADVYIPATGSVGIGALFLALSMTVGPVLTAGLDFCFPLGKPHSRGSPSLLISLAESGRLTPPGFYPYHAVRILEKVTSGKYTDKIMKNYAQRCMELCKAEGRVFQVGRSGIDIGMRSLDSLSGIRAVLNAGRPVERSDVFFPPVGNEAVTVFLAEEYQNLHASLTAYECGDIPSFVEKCDGLDYTFHHFADFSPFRENDGTFLFRIYVAQSQLKVHLERLIIRSQNG